MNAEEKLAILTELSTEKTRSSDLEKLLNEERQKNIELKEHSAKLQKSLDETQKNLLTFQRKSQKERSSSFSSSVSPLSISNGNLEIHNEGANSNVEQLQKTIEQLQQRLQTEKAEWEQQINQAKQVEQDLKNQLEELRNVDGGPPGEQSVTQLQTKLKRTEKQLEIYRKKYEEETQKHQKQVLTLEKENKNLKQELETLKTSPPSPSSPPINSTQSPTFTNSQSKNVLDLQQRISTLESELHQATQREHSLRLELQQEKTRFTELQSLNSLDDFKLTLQTEKEEKQRLQLQIQSQTKTIENQKKQILEMDKLCKSNLDQIQRLYEKSEKELETLRLENQDLKSFNNRLVKQFEQEKLQMELQTIQNLKEQIEELKKVYQSQTEFFSWAREYSPLDDEQEKVSSTNPPKTPFVQDFSHATQNQTQDEIYY